MLSYVMLCLVISICEYSQSLQRLISSSSSSSLSLTGARTVKIFIKGKKNENIISCACKRVEREVEVVEGKGRVEEGMV